MKIKEKLSKKINEVVSPYCHCEWCILKEIMISKSTDLRFLVQLKCIEHRKIELSEKFKYDVGWTGAHTEWINSGCATLFNSLYDEDKTAEQIYSEIIKISPISEAKLDV